MTDRTRKILSLAAGVLFLGLVGFVAGATFALWRNQ